MYKKIEDMDGDEFDSISAMARFYNLNKKILQKRLSKGWTVEQCLKDVPTQQIKKLKSKEEWEEVKQAIERSISSLEHNNKYINSFIRLNNLQILSIDEIEELIKQQYRKNVSYIEKKIYKDNNIKSYEQYVKCLNQFGLDKEIVSENLLIINFNKYITLVKLQTLNVGR